MEDSVEVKINRIAKKFYLTDENRRNKAKQSKLIIQQFVRSMYEHLMKLYNSGIKIHIFHIDNNIIHAGLFPCCSHNGMQQIQINESIRKETEVSIMLLTPFKNIIWEDLNE